jgi:uncharacterized membrane protein
MADIEGLLTRWQSAGVLDERVAERIRSWESEQNHPRGLRWQGIVALILGAILLACGVVLFVSAHWDDLAPGSRFALVLAMVSVFHLGGAWTRDRYRGLSTTLHAVGTIATGAAIALVGQIFNIEEHWPAAVLMWALAALAGWALLRDELQQSLTLLLVPAWMLSEFAYAANGHIGENVYTGRFLIVWAALYLTYPVHSKKTVVRGVTFAAAAIGLGVGVISALEGWRSWDPQTVMPLSLRVWAWLMIAVIPLGIAAVRWGKSMLPVVVALALGLALPWAQHVWKQRNDYGGTTNWYTHSDPNLVAHLLVTGSAILLIWWGVRQVSRSEVNLGIVYFALSVGWFYASNIYDKVGRSIGLIGLGILFLAGGWALEVTRRQLLARMAKPAGLVEVGS